MTTTTNTDPLAQRLAKAEAQAAKVRAELEQHQADAEAARQARLDAYDHHLAKTWQDREAAIQQDEAAAWKQFAGAVAADPVFGAWVQWKSGRERRRVLRDEAQGAINRVGLPDGVRAPGALGYNQSRLMEDIGMACDQAVSELVADTMEQLEQEREAAGAGG